MKVDKYVSVFNIGLQNTFVYRWNYFLRALFVGFCFSANSTARLIAAIMLSGRAMPLPAISNAVPWSGLVRGKGRPRVTFTPS